MSAPTSRSRGPHDEQRRDHLLTADDLLDLLLSSPEPQASLAVLDLLASPPEQSRPTRGRSSAPGRWAASAATTAALSDPQWRAQIAERLQRTPGLVDATMTTNPQLGPLIAAALLHAEITAANVEVMFAVAVSAEVDGSTRQALLDRLRSRTPLLKSAQLPTSLLPGHLSDRQAAALLTHLPVDSVPLRLRTAPASANALARRVLNESQALCQRGNLILALLLPPSACSPELRTRLHQAAREHSCTARHKPADIFDELRALLSTHPAQVLSRPLEVAEIAQVLREVTPKMRLALLRLLAEQRSHYDHLLAHLGLDVADKANGTPQMTLLAAAWRERLAGEVPAASAPELTGDQWHSHHAEQAQVGTLLRALPTVAVRVIAAETQLRSGSRRAVPSAVPSPQPAGPWQDPVRQLLTERASEGDLEALRAFSAAERRQLLPTDVALTLPWTEIGSSHRELLLPALLDAYASDGVPGVQMTVQVANTHSGSAGQLLEVLAALRSSSA